MTARAILFCLAMTFLASAVGAEIALQQVGSLSSPPPVAWGAWDERTLAVTDLDARLVTWPNGELSRARTLFDLPAPPSLMETWGDSVLIQVPGEGGRLLANGVNDPTVWIEKPANWRLPNTQYDGDTYRVLVDPLVFLLIYSAPGPGGILGLLDFADTIGQADHWAWAGDRVLLSNDDGVHVVDINNPQVPIITGTIVPPVAGWIAEGVAIRGYTAFVDWGSQISTYSVANPGTPPQLGEVLNLDPSFALGERWLVTWGRDEAPDTLTVYDAADPAAITTRGTITAPVAVADAPVVVNGDFVELAHELGLGRHEVPAGMEPPVDLGHAWPVLEGGLLATAGATAWLQGTDRRYALDLVDREVAKVQSRGSNSTTGSMFVRGDLLYYSRGAADGVFIESLADPQDPQPLTELDPTPGLEGIDVAGDLLAAADGVGLVLYDVIDPAAPGRRGELSLAGATRRVLVVDDTAVVTAYRESDPDLAHLVDISDRDDPQLIESFSLENPGWPSVQLRARQMVRRGDDVHLLMAGADGLSAAAKATATIDLSNPAVPALTYEEGDDFWCFVSDGAGDLVPTLDLPATIGDYHVSFREDTVSVYAYQGGADQLARQSSWVARHEIETIAAAGNKLLVFANHRIDILTLTDLDVVDVPDLVASTMVHAVPNPFNPQTAIVFEMPRAGTALVEIYDLRGGQVRRVEASLPAGPARLTWHGDDQAGRALSSGTYLLRVRTPAGILTGRCQLIR